MMGNDLEFLFVVRILTIFLGLFGETETGKWKVSLMQCATPCASSSGGITIRRVIPSALK